MLQKIFAKLKRYLQITLQSYFSGIIFLCLPPELELALVMPAYLHASQLPILAWAATTSDI